MATSLRHLIHSTSDPQRRLLQTMPHMNTDLIERLAGAGRLDRIFIGGEWVLPAGQDRSAVVDPSTEQPIAEIALGNAQDVAMAVAAARRAFATWSSSSPQSRAALLDRDPRADPGAGELFAQAISLEMGCAIALRARRTGAAGGRARPRGPRRGARAITSSRCAAPRPSCARRSACAALITPWNWPLYQITAKVGPGARGGLHGGAEAERTVAAQRAAVRRGGARRRRAAGRVQPRQRHRAGGRRGDGRASRRGHDLDHRLDPRRRAGGAGGRADRQARGAGAGRQVAQRDPARCRFRARRAGRRGGRVCAMSASRAARRRA